MNDVTLTMPYYCNSHLLAFHVGVWSQYPQNVLDHLKIIIVDDGSPERPAYDVLKKVPLDFSLYRIKEDKGWNFQGARNLAMKHCETEWVLLTDIDHVLYHESAEALVSNDWEKGKHYLPERRFADEREYYTHATTTICRKEDFWAVGGVDEDFAGTRGGDNGMRSRLEKRLEKVTTDKVTLRIWQSAMKGGRTTSLPRGPEERKIRHDIKSKKREGDSELPVNPIRFEWEQQI